MPWEKRFFLLCPLVASIALLVLAFSGCSSPSAQGSQEETPIEPLVSEADAPAELVLKGRYAVVNPEMSVFDLSIEEEGESVLFSSTARTVNLLDGEGRLQWSLNLEDLPLQAKLNPGGSRAAVGTNTGILYYLQGDGSELWRQQLRGSVELVSLSADGNFISASSQEKVEQEEASQGKSNFFLYLLNEKGRIIWTRKTGPVSSLFTAAGGDVFLSEGTMEEQRLMVYDCAGNIKWEMEGLALCDMDEAAGLLLALKGQEVYLLDFSGTVLWARKTPVDILKAQLSRKGEKVLVYGHGGGDDNLFCYNLKGDLSWQQRIPDGSLIEISAAGTRTVVASWQQYSEDYTQVQLLDSRGEKERELEIASRVEKVALSRDGSTLALAGGDGNIYILDLEMEVDSTALLEAKPIYYRPVSFQKPGNEVAVRLYFFDAKARYLIPVTRYIKKTPSILQETINELIKGPSRRSELSRIIPKDATIEVSLHEGVAYLDLPEELNRLANSSQAAAALRSLLLTSSQFSTVDSICFLVEGRRVEHFCSDEIAIDKNFPAHAPGSKRPVLYFPSRSGSRYYLLVQDGKEINYPLKDDEDLLKALFQKGKSFFPEGLSVLGIELYSNKMIVNLSEEFMKIFPVDGTEEDKARAAVILDAIFLTIAENFGPDTISLMVNGRRIQPEGYPLLEREITRPFYINPE